MDRFKQDGDWVGNTQIIYHVGILLLKNIRNFGYNMSKI